MLTGLFLKKILTVYPSHAFKGAKDERQVLRSISDKRHIKLIAPLYARQLLEKCLNHFVRVKLKTYTFFTANEQMTQGYLMKFFHNFKNQKITDLKPDIIRVLSVY